MNTDGRRLCDCPDPPRRHGRSCLQQTGSIIWNYDAALLVDARGSNELKVCLCFLLARGVAFQLLISVMNALRVPRRRSVRTARMNLRYAAIASGETQNQMRFLSSANDLMNRSRCRSLSPRRPGVPSKATRSMAAIPSPPRGRQGRYVEGMSKWGRLQ